ncbi:MAG: type II toxin-antitoxin system RelE/ParE family toxin [Taibaiella sp.]|nr:type II toxin-antitoxin system RelE/ParE family toxin [Taibaiella sp.]
MAYKIELRPLAAFEIIEAYDWYEQQSPGLGAALLNELDIFYNTLLANPYIYSYYDKPVREGRLNRFPYQVVYEVFDTAIVIYSIFMAKQDPRSKRTM